MRYADTRKLKCTYTQMSTSTLVAAVILCHHLTEAGRTQGKRAGVRVFVGAQANTQSRSSIERERARQRKEPTAMSARGEEKQHRKQYQHSSRRTNTGTDDVICSKPQGRDTHSEHTSNGETTTVKG